MHFSSEEGKMRLSDVLSKDTKTDFVQIEGFLENRILKIGSQKKIRVGKIALNYYCKVCTDYRTFCSGDDLFCVGVNDQLVSIDSALKCPQC
jgi:hypothetical protein